MRFLTPTADDFWAPPGWMTILAALGCAAMFVFISAKAGQFSSDVSALAAQRGMAALLQQYGALLPRPLAQQEGWRLIASGFLHAGVLALVVNMLALFAFGGLAERHLGALQTALVVAASICGAAVASILGPPQYFIAQGMQGGAVGLCGALLSLWVMRRVPLPVPFFLLSVVTIFALAVCNSRAPLSLTSWKEASWLMIVAGLLAGFLAGGALGALARFSDPLMRCKFPEYIKIELGLALAFAAYWLSSTSRLAISLTDVTGLALMLVVSLVAIKLTDLVLSMKRGLALLALLFAAGCACVPYVLSGAVNSFAAGQCSQAARASWRGLGLDSVAGMLCAQQRYAIYVAMAVVFIAVLLMHWVPLKRGLKDVGFIGAGLRGARGREQTKLRRRAG